MRDASENRSRLHPLPISEMTRSETEDLLLLANEVAKAGTAPLSTVQVISAKMPSNKKGLICGT